MTPDLPPSPPESAPPPAAVVAPAPQDELIGVDSHGYYYAVKGNNSLLPREVVARTLEGALAPQAAIDALKAAYSQAGYPLIAVTAEAHDKLIAVQVIHGRITELDVTPPSVVPFFTGLVGIEDISRNAVIRASTMAEFFLSRDGLRPSVNFGPGKEFATTKLIATAQPIDGASRANATLSFGNLGSRYSSRYLGQASGAIRPGDGLELTAGYGQGIPGLSSDSAGSVYRNVALGGSLVTPWGLYGMNLSKVAYTLGKSAAPLYPAGDITIGTINGTQLVFASEVSRWTVNEAYAHTDHLVDVFDGAFRITNQRYDMLTAGTSYNTAFTLLDQNASLAATLSGNFGVSHRSGTFLPVDLGVPSPRFNQALASLNYVQALPEGYSVSLSLSGQWSDTTVPQNQEWVLGGFGNLTAWLPAIMVGDSGMLFRASVGTPSWAWSGLSFSGTAFFEAGVVQTYFTPVGQPDNRAASDAGLSVSASWTGGTSATLAYAWPLTTHNVPVSTLNGQGRANLYFTLSQTF